MTVPWPRQGLSICVLLATLCLSPLAPTAAQNTLHPYLLVLSFLPDADGFQPLRYIDLKTGESFQIEESGALEQIQEIAISPQGTYTMLITHNADHRDLALVTQLEPLTSRVLSHSGNETGLSWSPSGREVSFYLEDEPGLYRYSVERNTFLSTIDSDPNFEANLRLPAWGSPKSWSPDGRYISSVLYNVNAENDELHILNRESSEIYQRYIFDHSRISLGDFSPNGENLSLIRYSQENSESGVYILSIPQNEIRQLTNDNGVSLLRWASDSQRLAFVDLEEDEGVFVIDSQGSLLMTLSTQHHTIQYFNYIGQPNFRPFDIENVSVEWLNNDELLILLNIKGVDPEVKNGPATLFLVGRLPIACENSICTIDDINIIYHDLGDFYTYDVYVP